MLAMWLQRPGSQTLCNKLLTPRGRFAAWKMHRSFPVPSLPFSLMDQSPRPDQDRLRGKSLWKRLSHWSKVGGRFQEERGPRRQRFFPHDHNRHHDTEWPQVARTKNSLSLRSWVSQIKYSSHCRAVPAPWLEQKTQTQRKVLYFYLINIFYHQLAKHC